MKRGCWFSKGRALPLVDVGCGTWWHCQVERRFWGVMFEWERA